MDICIVLRPFILLSLLTVAAITDIFKHRVSNHIIAAGFVAEFLVHMLSKPVVEPDELGVSILFILICFALFVLRLLGGADVKLYALCVFTYPDETGFRIICLSLIIGACYALLVKFKTVYTCDRGYISLFHSADVIPMSAAILAGTLLAVI